MAYKITNRVTGEVQMVHGIDGYNPDDWTFEKMGRAPKSYEALDPETGKLCDHRSKLKDQSMPCSREELKQLIREVIMEEKNK